MRARLLESPRFLVRQMLTVGVLPSPLKLAYYRLRCAKIGQRVSIGFGAVVVADEMETGEGVTIGFGTCLRARRVRIGRFARIGAASLGALVVSSSSSRSGQLGAFRV